MPDFQRCLVSQSLTCLTRNYDAGVPRELIAAISGHQLTPIDEVMRRYAARTADQAATALHLRLDHEAGKVSSR